MGSTAVTKVPQLMMHLGTAVDRGADKALKDTIDIAQSVMNRPKFYKVTSRTGRSYPPRAVTQKVQFRGNRMIKLKYVPAAPAYWTEYGTRPHWIYPHGVGRTRSVYDKTNPFSGRVRGGREGGKRALKTDQGEFYNNVFVSGVRPRPFWRKTRKDALRKATDNYQRRNLQAILSTGFGR